PPPLAEAVATRAASSHAALPDGGVAAEASSGLYAPLVARDRLVGLLALEHRDPGRFGTRHVQLVNGLAEPLALAIDNALWFARLQALGAEGERSRIARSLHDGVGQGLAYIALELDRIGAARPDPDLARLRDDTRGLLRDVRETLHQLRAEVTESKDLGTLAEAHLRRFSERTGISASLSSEPTPERLPVLVEHEVWRILQEALENVERHARASRVEVTWWTDGRRGRLRVEDDGCGFDPATQLARATPGLRIMRERANAVGGRLDIHSSPGEGTTVVVEVKVSR
ncbi:MAG: sensor histidine kinase, partial [Acidimicrobiia bacterium]